MSKQLLVMRHAKSSWANAGLTDFERPLNKRGLRVAPQMAEFIQQQGLVPDQVVSSAACRAKMTAELFVENCESMSPEQLAFTNDFYHAPASTYLSFVKRFSDESVNSLMFVGHNPGMEDLVEELGGCWEVMPTAAIAHFTLEHEAWNEMIDGPIKSTLRNIWRPKDIDIM